MAKLSVVNTMPMLEEETVHNDARVIDTIPYINVAGVGVIKNESDYDYAESLIEKMNTQCYDTGDIVADVQDMDQDIMCFLTAAFKYIAENVADYINTKNTRVSKEIMCEYVDNGK